ncbi:hypothetical protein [Parapedobacter sp. 10938]|uniref:hypothetical protein n=1 Tax=Parapedobacter flavus TaxID=3110225 RepID=UPI002DB7B28C|nr:hypothetical protein [Parapedobacter sp. 10938]MEC3880223.1 hypothetical protein [Parapedobacter sp. 10938]
MKKITAIWLSLVLNVGIMSKTFSQEYWNNYQNEKTYAENQTRQILQKDLFTGTANVNIPIYDYNVNGIDLGVRIIYNTSGILVDRLSSPIGMGWELFCGARIDREIRGIQDEKFHTYKVWAGYVNGNIYKDIKYRGFWHPTDANITHNDFEPDLFHLNLGGKPITFMFSRTGELLTIPNNSNFNIQRIFNGIPIYGQIPNNNTDVNNLLFVVTDENHNKFYFSSSQHDEGSTYHANTNTYTYSNRTVISSWLLDKVVTYEGKEINFTYDIIHIATGEELSNSQTFQTKNNNYGESFSMIQYGPTRYSQLKKIEYPNNINVEFQYENTDRLDAKSKRLISIKVNEKCCNGQNYVYHFNQSYMMASPSSQLQSQSGNSFEVPCILNYNGPVTFQKHQARLFLMSIDLQRNNQTKKYYSFEYDPRCLPERLYGGRDRFGYANNSKAGDYHNIHNSQNYSLLTIPKAIFTTGTYPNTNEYFGADDMPNFTGLYAAAGSLTKIKNSTGGQISFSYKSPLASGIITSGLILDHIEYYDGYNHDNDVTSEYSYTNAEHFVNEGYASRPFSTIDYNHTQQTWTLYFNHANLLNTGLNGSRYGFLGVEEINKDRNGILLNSIKYKFSGIYGDLNADIGHNTYNPPFPLSTHPDYNKPYGVAPYTNKQYIRSWGIGLPTQIEFYNQSSSLIKIVENKYIITSNYLQTQDWEGEHSLRTQRDVNDEHNTSWIRDVYYPFTGKAVLTSKTEKNYVSPTDYNTITTQYESDKFGNVIIEKVDNSKIEQLESLNVYSYFALHQNSGAAANKLASEGIRKVLYKQKEKDGKLLDITPIGYSVVSGNIIRPKYFYALKKNSLLSPINPYSFSMYSIPHYPTNGNLNNLANLMSQGLSVPNFELKSTITKFDSRGFALEQTDRTGTKVNASIWDNIREISIAEAVNAKHEEVAYCGFESIYQNTPDHNKGNWEFNIGHINSANYFLGRYSYHIFNGNGIWTTQNLQLGKKYIVSYWAKQGGTIDVNDGIDPIPNSQSTKQLIKTYNGWSLYRCEFVAKATNIGMWGDGYVDELRVYPADAQMTNLNYLPLVGKTSEVDINDRITFYEYDAFGNLSIVRDDDGNIISKTETIIQGND